LAKRQKVTARCRKLFHLYTFAAYILTHLVAVGQKLLYLRGPLRSYLEMSHENNRAWPRYFLIIIHYSLFLYYIIQLLLHHMGPTDRRHYIWDTTKAFEQLTAALRARTLCSYSNVRGSEEENCEAIFRRSRSEFIILRIPRTENGTFFGQKTVVNWWLKFELLLEALETFFFSRKPKKIISQL
jgi:hypothetical protein